MNKVVLIMLFVFLNYPLNAQEKAQIFQGTLVQKEDKWFLFINQGVMPLPKGLVELQLMNANSNKNLMNQTRVSINGILISCGKRQCLQVLEINPEIENYNFKKQTSQ